VTLAQALAELWKLKWLAAGAYLLGGLIFWWRKGRPSRWLEQRSWSGLFVHFVVATVFWFAVLGLDELQDAWQRACDARAR
jgi:hypothetical protein